MNRGAAFVVDWTTDMPIKCLSIYTAIDTLPGRIEDILYWMNSNKLMLNTDKIEVMAVSTSSRLSRVDCNSANIDGSIIPFKTSVKYLGVKIDQTLTTQNQISSVCRASYFELRRLVFIRPYLLKELPQD